MLRELATKDPKIKVARPEEFVDLTFIKELDSSGFIDRLYKTQPVVASGEKPRSTPTLITVKEKSPPANEKTGPSVGAAESVGKSTATDGSRQYTVERGDTLSYLALQHYGDPFKWEKIYEANKETMKNPHYIYVGQRIIIPS
jgi:nucleoid-associated protein YgaU